MKALTELILTAALLLLFTYAALSKLADPELFRAQLYLQPFSHGLADLLVYGLPATELITVALLCLDRTRPAGLWLSLILMGAFTGYIGLILLLRQGHLPCSCGGILSRMSWPVHLVFNVCCLLAAAAAIRLHAGRPAAGKALR